MSYRILAFDQSTSTTGVAVGDSTQGLRDYFVTSLRTPKNDVFGERLAWMHREFEKLIKEHRPDIIAFEEPLMPVNMPAFKAAGEQAESRQAPFNAEIVKKLMMVAGCVMTVAALYGVPCESYASSSWRVTFLGMGRAPKGSEKDFMKKAALQRAKQLGYDVKGHDEADALGLLVHGLTGAPAAMRAQGSLLDMARL